MVRYLMKYFLHAITPHSQGLSCSRFLHRERGGNWWETLETRLVTTQRLINLSKHYYFQGYYMAAQGYEILLSLLSRREIILSPREHVMFYLLYKNQWNSKPFHFHCERRHLLLCNHSNGDLLHTWRYICYLLMLFSRVNTSCCHAKAHLVFRWLLSNKATYFLPNLLFQGLWRR